TSNGFRWSRAFQGPRATPDWTRPFSIPTSLVVQTSAAGPRIIAPVSPSPWERSLREAGRAGGSAGATPALGAPHRPKLATSRLQASTHVLARLAPAARDP